MNVKKRGGVFWALAAGILLLFGSGGLPETVQAEVVIIANSSVAVSGVTPGFLKEIYTGKTVVWDDGRPIKPAILKDGDVYDEFVRTYTQRTTNQFQNYWRKMIFTGQGIEPKIFSNTQDLVDYVAETEGAIGYVSSSEKAAKTKTLNVLGN